MERIKTKLVVSDVAPLSLKDMPRKVTAFGQVCNVLFLDTCNACHSALVGLQVRGGGTVRVDASTIEDKPEVHTCPPR